VRTTVASLRAFVGATLVVARGVTGGGAVAGAHKGRPYKRMARRAEAGGHKGRPYEGWCRCAEAGGTRAAPTRGMVSVRRTGGHEGRLTIAVRHIAGDNRCPTRHRMMRDPPMHRRRSLRLKGYDCAQAGAYFVTICTQDRVCLFGEVVDDAMYTNDAGQMLTTMWSDIPARFADVELDAFVVMPNHAHGIIVLPDKEEVVAHDRATKRAVPTIGDVVGAFKSAATVTYIRGVKSAGSGSDCGSATIMNT
jgi:putative transposase